MSATRILWVPLIVVFALVLATTLGATRAHVSRADGEVEGLARDHGLSVLRVTTKTDIQERADMSWTLIALQLPDDGSASLPLLRGIILNDDKSSTYKLACCVRSPRSPTWPPSSPAP